MFELSKQLQEGFHLFSPPSKARTFLLPEDISKRSYNSPKIRDCDAVFTPIIDERVLDIYSRASNPSDPLELRDLWLGRVEHELGAPHHRVQLARRWKATTIRRRISADEVLESRATVRFVKELFNWFFRQDLYGDFRSDSNLILSSGSVDEENLGLPEALKDCLRFAIKRDWYGYSDSRGRIPAREAVAAYESARINGAMYNAQNIALTMGGTFAISTLADFLLSGRPNCQQPVLCGIPNYPPLVESLARRHSIRLVPLPSRAGQVSLEPLIASLTPNTPVVFLQTVINPTGASVDEGELASLIRTASPSTLILLDECHEWLGSTDSYCGERAARNVIRVSSLSKKLSVPGLKIGWIIADSEIIDDYYEYASSTFGGPPSFFYTLVEVFARMERWIIRDVHLPEHSELNEFENSYGLDLKHLQLTYSNYRREQSERESALTTLRNATEAGFSEMPIVTVPPRSSINMALKFPTWDDSYRCFRDLLRETGVAVFPGILTFCFSGGVVRITTARPWEHLRVGIERINSHLVGVPRVSR